VPPSLERRLAQEDVAHAAIDASPGSDADAAATIATAREAKADWIVVDGYAFGAQYQQRLRESGHRLLFVDDYGHAEYYAAHVVLNQNIDADASLYAHREADTDLLLGPSYAMLRKEFWDWRDPRRRPRQDAQRLLVTLGGADPDNLTTLVVDALNRHFARTDVQITVVVGGSNPNEARIQAAVAEAEAQIDLRHDVTNMASLMSESDVAVSAGGSTCWELAFMGIPTVIVVLADNQRGIARGLHDANTAVNLGWHTAVDGTDVAEAVERLLLDDERRLRMAGNAQALVDGRGVERIVQTLRHPSPQA
jgi:UDP-2,4-diacetamido-2,4,6-trideoxy-beta-L-altropyranose hydrolase